MKSNKLICPECGKSASSVLVIGCLAFCRCDSCCRQWSKIIETKEDAKPPEPEEWEIQARTSRCPSDDPATTRGREISICNRKE